MTTRELFAPAPELSLLPDPARTTPEPASGPTEPDRANHKFAAVIDHELRPKSKRPRTEPAARRDFTKRALDGKTADEAERVLEEEPSATEPEETAQPVAHAATGEGVPQPSVIIPFPEAPAFFAPVPAEARVTDPEVEIDVAWPPWRSAFAQGSSAPNLDPIQSQAPAAGEVIVPVDFGGSPPDAPWALSHLPGPEVKRENSAPSDGMGSGKGRARLVSEPGLAALFRAVSGLAEEAGTGRAEVGGISAALSRTDMDSLLDADQANGADQGSALGDRHQKALDDLDGISVKVSEPEVHDPDFPARSLSATDWQTGRPVGLTDRPTPSSAPATSSAESLERAEAVARLSQLVLRESALTRQHGADSMSVVLRPDADTELLVHFSQKNGHLQAAVRCERGDFHHLSALWPQLQESLAQQKVSLAPLEASSRPDDFRHAPGSNSTGTDSGNDPTGQQGPRADASDVDEGDGGDGSLPKTRRGWGQDRGQTVSMPHPSRPGWETWA